MQTVREENRKETGAVASDGVKQSAPAETLPIRVRIDGVEYALSKLEQSTFVVHGYFGSLIAPQRFNFHFVFEIGGETIEVPTHGTLRKLEDGRLRASFFAPQPYYQRLMRKAMRRPAKSAA